MFTSEELKKAIDAIIEVWGEVGEKVIQNAFIEHKYITYEEFQSHCILMGGNWGGMWLSGIKELYPKTWNAIPDDMGVNAVIGIISTLQLCGVDTTGRYKAVN